jgi:hypothetical protein
MAVTNGLKMKTKQPVHNAESYSAEVTRMIDWITRQIDTWEQLPWTPRGHKFRIVIEFIVITCFVLVCSIDIK